MKRVFEQVKTQLEEVNLPLFRVGDLVRVHRRVKEGNKERVQIVEGEIIAHKHGFEPGATITLRRVTLGVAVELVLPIYSPNTEKIQIVKRQKANRAKLYYLRNSIGKKGKLKENIEATKKLKKVQEEAKNKEKRDNKKEKANVDAEGSDIKTPESKKVSKIEDKNAKEDLVNK